MDSEIAKKLVECDIEKGLHFLISEMWQRGYETRWSCEGHGSGNGYIIYKESSGNGWFEKLVSSFKKVKDIDWSCRTIVKTPSNNGCCQVTEKNAINSVIIDGKEIKIERTICPSCSGGVNGFAKYVGDFKEFSRFIKEGTEYRLYPKQNLLEDKDY